MAARARAVRLVIVFGVAALAVGLGIWVLGPGVLILAPATVLLMERPLDWALDTTARDRLAVATRAAGDNLTSEQISQNLTTWRNQVIDDDPDWGKLVEGTESGWGRPLVAVQVTNATANEHGEFEKIWLRVPARGDHPAPRRCTKCQRDIGFPPRTAKEAIAWTFRLCETDYLPATAS